MPKLIHALLPLTTAAAGVSASAIAARVTDDWRRVATERDEQRIANLSRAWDVGLREAAARNSRDLNRLGALIRPAGALARPQPTPGNYRCRTIKLGSQGEVGLGYIAYGWFNCRISLSAGGDLTLAKTTGSQRPMGKLYPRSARQLVFLGTLALSSSERGWPTYGSNSERDIAGVFERVGAGQYRLVMPQPAYESELDVLEMRGPIRR